MMAFQSRYCALFIVRLNLFNVEKISICCMWRHYAVEAMRKERSLRHDWFTDQCRGNHGPSLSRDLHRLHDWGPSKHETLAERWFTAGPPSSTLAQQQINVQPTSHVCWGGTSTEFAGQSQLEEGSGRATDSCPRRNPNAHLDGQWSVSRRQDPSTPSSSFRWTLVRFERFNNHAAVGDCSWSAISSLSVVMEFTARRRGMIEWILFCRQC